MRVLNCVKLSSGHGESGVSERDRFWLPVQSAEKVTRFGKVGDYAE